MGFNSSRVWGTEQALFLTYRVIHCFVLSCDMSNILGQGNLIYNSGAEAVLNQRIQDSLSLSAWSISFSRGLD